MTPPLVSVIIIFLNAEKFLKEAIESVFAQSFPGWELLLVDDGSTDKSTKIARTVAAQHPGRVRYLEHPGHRNRGMSASRNLGIQNARGIYLAFLDADDCWFPRTLKEQVSILETHPDAALVYGPVMVWYSWTGKAEDGGRDYVEKLGVPANRLVQPPHLLPLFLQDMAAVPSGFLVRKKQADVVGGFENAFHGEYEDQVFCAKICLHAPVFPTDRCWYRYRQHPGSSVSIGQSTGRTLEARRIFLEWLGSYLIHQKVKDREIWRALHRERRRFNHPWLFHLIRKNRHRLPWLARI